MTETLTRKCPECYLTYTYPKDSNMRHLENHELSLCHEIYDKLFLKGNATYFQQIAKNMEKFLEENFSLKETLDYMQETLLKVSQKQSREYVIKQINDRKLIKYSCEKLRHDHLESIGSYGHGYRWIYNEWYNNETCKMNLDSNYLRYFPA